MLARAGSSRPSPSPNAAHAHVHTRMCTRALVHSRAHAQSHTCARTYAGACAHITNATARAQSRLGSTCPAHTRACRPLALLGLSSCCVRCAPRRRSTSRRFGLVQTSPLEPVSANVGALLCSHGAAGCPVWHGLRLGGRDRGSHKMGRDLRPGQRDDVLADGVQHEPAGRSPAGGDHSQYRRYLLCN
jgi:hypothetical protein